MNSNPETSIHKVTSSLKSLHSGETTECVVNEIAADVYSIGTNVLQIPVVDVNSPSVASLSD